MITVALLPELLAGGFGRKHGRPLDDGATEAVVADYYRAMNDVERRLELVPTPEQPQTEPGQLVAMVDALSSGTLNDSQRQLVHALRSGILALAEQKESETDFAAANVLG